LVEVRSFDIVLPTCATVSRLGKDLANLRDNIQLPVPTDQASQT
jgi:hypothetical protein